MNSASYLAPTIHILVVIILKYLKHVQFDEKDNNLF